MSKTVESNSGYQLLSMYSDEFIESIVGHYFLSRMTGVLQAHVDYC
jgi:hypothetical protein